MEPSPERYNKLVSQLKWRLSESPCAAAVYELGVEDDGLLSGLEAPELAKSLNTLRRMAADVAAHCSMVRRVQLASGAFVAEVIVRRLPSTHDFVETSVAFVGSTGAGKTTLMGVLTRCRV